MTIAMEVFALLQATTLLYVVMVFTRSLAALERKLNLIESRLTGLSSSTNTCVDV